MGGQTVEIKSYMFIVEKVEKKMGGQTVEIKSYVSIFDFCIGPKVRNQHYITH